VSRQCSSPDGAPLYPVLRIRLSLTMIAPTALLLHVVLLATSFVMSIKY